MPIFWGLVSQICEILSVGARQRTRGSSPRGLGGVRALVQGLRPGDVAIQHSFQLALALFQPASAFFSVGNATLALFGPIQIAHRASKEVRLTRGTSPPSVSRFNRGYGLCHSLVRSPRVPAHVRAIRGTLVFLSRPSVRLSARRRGEASHATLARAASHGCFSELFAGSSSERQCPIR